MENGRNLLKVETEARFAKLEELVKQGSGAVQTPLVDVKSGVTEGFQAIVRLPLSYCIAQWGLITGL